MLLHAAPVPVARPLTGHHHPFPFPGRPWSYFALDFVTGLTTSNAPAHFIACQDTRFP